MDYLNELLADLSSYKAQAAELESKLTTLKAAEEGLRKSIADYMLDNGIEKKTSPDGKWSATLTARKSVTVNDKPGLVAYAMANRKDLLSVDLVKAKAEMKADPEIKQYFKVESTTGITISEVKETIRPIETQAQFVARVRAEGGE